jgi:hypothetical protein
MAKTRTSQILEGEKETIFAIMKVRNKRNAMMIIHEHVYSMESPSTVPFHNCGIP